MALIICPECGKKFSDKAPACPECGCPTEYILNCENLDDTDPVQAEQQGPITIRENDNTMRRTNTGFRFVHCMERKYPRLQRRKSNVRTISDYMCWG